MLMDEAAVRRALARITHEIVERNCGADDLVLLGIRRRGVPLARMLSDNIARFEGVEVPVAELDVTLHRDDIDPARKAAMHPAPLSLPFDISGKTVIMVDDVLFTGRTARAAMDAIFSLGRPRSLQFAVLIDRGHRELPIRADYVGKNVPTSMKERVHVQVEEYDGANAVLLMESPS